MPLVRIDLRAGKSAEYRKALGDGVHRAMIEALAIPPDDRFQVITEHPAEGLIYDAHYLGIPRTDNVVFVQITLSAGRKPSAKAETFQTDGGNTRGISRTEAAGVGDQSGGSGVGELVVRKRRSAVHGYLIMLWNRTALM